ncbi:Rossmann-like domain-containing protein [Sedimenticola selenatireducens]|uniref:Putative heavy-metal chelation domain-containing protein n=1 Tax=Sedimenticola selenatireducens TaxID=191960 RepID=A0A557RUM5_9GAMM|nr:DUF364 domain-containing protein [Sedimenticola selenatireducens]TVO68864.1 hypothetical protein FHP88_18255 [Sedimenticola selenatireducens]TVT61236.1 MAG: hypothetical protein FHK78_18220 [Sedimenticola selenatireducens]
MSSLNQYHQLIKQIEQAISPPVIKEILLPAVDESNEDDIKDNFGFVILEDGSAGPFYTCLDNTLEWLHGQRQQCIGVTPLQIAQKLDGINIPASALALGAFNAISQHIMRRAGFNPSALEKRSDSNISDSHIGMVGFFRPLIERYIKQGKKVTVIEQQPERVPPELSLKLYTTPEALADCDYILCTASTLINNTIESIVHAAKDPAKINLIGPSASGLPDILFDLGIHSTGGFIVDNLDALKLAMSQGESWGSAGRKYQLTQDIYPGLASLLQHID